MPKYLVWGKVSCIHFHHWKFGDMKICSCISDNSNLCIVGWPVSFKCVQWKDVHCSVTSILPVMYLKAGKKCWDLYVCFHIIYQQGSWGLKCVLPPLHSGFVGYFEVSFDSTLDVDSAVFLCVSVILNWPYMNRVTVWDKVVCFTCLQVNSEPPGLI